MSQHTAKVPILTPGVSDGSNHQASVLAGEERMRHIFIQTVGDNLKGQIAPFSVTIPFGGEEIKGAPLVFIPHLVNKVVKLLDGNEW